LSHFTFPGESFWDSSSVVKCRLIKNVSKQKAVLSKEGKYLLPALLIVNYVIH